MINNKIMNKIEINKKASEYSKRVEDELLQNQVKRSFIDGAEYAAAAENIPIEKHREYIQDKYFGIYQAYQKLREEYPLFWDKKNKMYKNTLMYICEIISRENYKTLNIPKPMKKNSIYKILKENYTNVY